MARTAARAGARGAQAGARRVTISDVQVIPFTVRRRGFHNAELQPPADTLQTVTRVVTDQGAEGYYFGGAGHGDQSGLTAADRQLLTGRIRDLVVGHDPFDREKFWRWLWVANLPEHLISVLDNALWDLHELRRGAAGFMPATEMTDVHVQIWDAWHAGGESRARGLFNRLLPLINLTCLLGLAVCKEVLVRRGVFGSTATRVPGSVRLDAEDRRELDQILLGLQPLLRV